MRYTMLLSLLLFSLLSYAQGDIYEHFNLVIAQSGLNIRAEPSLAGSIVAKAPYHSKVKYLSDQSFGHDTIGVLKNYFRQYEAEQNKLTQTDDLLTGDWVKVKYREKTGYTFNAYLGPELNPQQDAEYFIISPGEDCGNDYYDLTKYYCYGLYGHGTETELRQVAPSYVVQMTGIGFLAPLLTLPDNDELRLVLGSKQPLPTVSSDFLLNEYTEVWTPTPTAGNDQCGMLTLTTVTDTVTISKTPSVRINGHFRLGNKQQAIQPNVFIYTLSIIGCGDLDGDDIPDYLIHNNCDESTYKSLYLSSLAKGGEVLGLACQEHFGYCC